MISKNTVPITVLMTVYNASRYLSISIESVLSQTFREFEFLIVDDCSTDNSVALIQSYKDKRVRLISNSANIGQTKSLNIGLNHAMGKYIARIDADDLAFPEWLEYTYEFAKSNPEYSVVSPYAVIVDKRYQIKEIRYLPLSFAEVIMTILTESPINHGGAFMRKQEIVSIGGYDETRSIVADYALWSELIARGYKITNFPNVLTVVCEHDESASARKHGNPDLKKNVVDIMSKNISLIVENRVPRCDIDKVWGLIHDIKAYDINDIDHAAEIMMGLYDNMREELSITKHEKRLYKAKRLREIHMRKVYLCIYRKEFRLARQTLKSCVSKDDFFSLFYVAYLMSKSKTALLKMISIYYVFNKYFVRFRLIDKQRYITNMVRRGIL